MRSLLSGLLLAGWLGASVMAQTTTSSLVGQVSTAEAKPVVDAVVTARSHETGSVRSGISDAEGQYRIDLLTPGQWTVAATLIDGRASEPSVVELRLQQTVRLDFTVGSGLQEKVTVTAAAPLVDRKETGGKLLVTRDQAESLPLPGRVFTDLARLDSSVGAAAPGNFYGERGSVFVVNGQSGRANSFLVDGLDNNDQVSGTNLNSFYSQQVIQEFVLLTHQYSPEFGRASGGVLNIVTRRGANQPSWDAFAQGTSSSWNDAGDFVESLPDGDRSQDAVTRYQAGFSLGGPIRKDRAFYFVAYEHQENDDVLPFTGLTRDQVGTDAAGGRMVAESDDDNLFLRADFNLDPSNSLMLRLTADDRTTSGVNVGGLFTPETGFRIEEQDIALAASLTTVISPGLMNEARVLLATSSFDQFANSDRPGVTRPSGTFGGNNLNLQFRDEDRVQLIENLTWHSGEHTIKFGLDLSRSETRIATEFNPNGNFLYEVDDPFDLNDLDTYPYLFQFIDGEPEADLHDTKIALFAQDRWQVGPRLLLDYGLRYDLSTFTLDGRVDSVIPNGGADRDEDNLAPRFGFTFSPRVDGKLVLRGGGGIFYDKLVLGFPAVASITSGTEIGLSFPQGFGIPMTEEVVEELGIDFARQVLVFPDELILKFSTDTELETPYTVQYNLGLERAVGRYGAFRLNVVRAQGYHLALMKDLNPVLGTIDVGVDCNEQNIDPTFETGVLPCHLRDPTTGSIAAITTDGRSWYTGVDLDMRWQRDDGWLSTSYTWSKADDTGFDPLKDGISLPPDSDTLTGERGRADGDRRHKVVVSGDTGLPWMGLRASGVLQVASGVPFNVTTGRDDNLDGILTDRPEGVARNTGEDTPLGPVNELRLEAGLEPVSSLNESSFSQVDLRVYRPFSFKDGRGQGEIFFQVFNLLDRENTGLVEGRVLSRNFGRTVTLSGPPRTLELGFKIGY